MPYLVVPSSVSATRANVWVGAINENPGAAQVVLEASPDQVVIDGWEHWSAQSGGATLDHERVELGGLEPRRSYGLRLTVDGQVRASGSVTTLPDQLPSAERPFTVLLGSCFCVQKDGAGRVGNTYFNLPAGARPEVKILCGDQVYLDAPWQHYLLATHNEREMETEFFANYVRTWAQSGTGAGFLQMLQEGANYFSSDDHELWNNAPNAGVYVRDTWSGGGRKRWLKIAQNLYRRFQAQAPVTTFQVPPLSFLIADTRIGRSSDRTTLMDPVEFARVLQWIAGLRGPGVLVVGQPVFTGKTGFRGHISDWALPDFEQYADLARALGAAKHSIVILTGDVHFGRFAVCDLGAGVKLVEVISSPMGLVDARAKGTWGAAPDVFPIFDIPGMTKRAIHTPKSFQPAEDHFLTLEFSASGASVKMAVRGWSIAGPAGTMRGEVVATEELL